MSGNETQRDVSASSTASTGESNLDDSAQQNSRHVRGRRKGLRLVLLIGLALSLVGISLVKSETWVALLPESWFAADFGGLAELAQISKEQAKDHPRYKFDLSGLQFPAAEIRDGGPPKDGIPALSNPKFVTVENAGEWRPDDRIIGVAFGKEAKAYPLKILNYHEIVNDRVGETAVAVTYCPLCDSAAVFDRGPQLQGGELGVSGLLYNSNVLMYDRSGKPESLWSQLKSEGVAGPGVKKSLTRLPLELTTWKDWHTRYPQTLVLSVETGHKRPYRHDPYGDYFTSAPLFFPARPVNDRLPKKERVLGVMAGGSSRAYPESAFGEGRTKVEDQLEGKNVTIEFNPAEKTFRVAAADDGVTWMYSLWFAWYAFHPDTTIFDPAEK